jgi:hypothetical protein
LQALNVVTNTMKNALKTGWRAGIYRAQPAGQGHNGIRGPADSLKLFLVNLLRKPHPPFRIEFQNWTKSFKPNLWTVKRRASSLISEPLRCCVLQGRGVRSLDTRVWQSRFIEAWLFCFQSRIPVWISAIKEGGARVWVLASLTLHSPYTQLSSCLRRACTYLGDGKLK